MSRTIEIELEYTDSEGKDCIKKLKISKVFNWVMEAYDEINVIMAETTENFKEIQVIDKKIDGVLSLMKDDWYEARAELLKEKKELTKKIRGVSKNGFFKKRFTLASGILKDNNINDDFLHSEKFWDRQVEPNQLVTFLQEAAFKDVMSGQKGDDKKK